MHKNVENSKNYKSFHIKLKNKRGEVNETIELQFTVVGVEASDLIWRQCTHKI